MTSLPTLRQLILCTPLICAPTLGACDDADTSATEGDDPEHGEAAGTDIAHVTANVQKDGAPFQTVDFTQGHGMAGADGETVIVGHAKSTGMFSASIGSLGKWQISLGAHVPTVTTGTYALHQGPRDVASYSRGAEGGTSSSGSLTLTRATLEQDAGTIQTYTIDGNFEFVVPSGASTYVVSGSFTGVSLASG